LAFEQYEHGAMSKGYKNSY